MGRWPLPETPFRVSAIAKGEGQMKLRSSVFFNDFWNWDIGSIHKGNPQRVKKALKKQLSRALRKDKKIDLSKYGE
jgi:hypothetical protein